MRDDLGRRLEEGLTEGSLGPDLGDVIRRGRRRRNKERLFIGALTVMVVAAGVGGWRLRSLPVANEIATPGPSTSVPMRTDKERTFEVRGELGDMRVDGNLMIFERQVCLHGEFTGVKAAHLHFDDASANDPVIVEFFAPPGRAGGGTFCQVWDDPAHEAPDVLGHPEDYFLDFHPDETSDPLEIRLVQPLGLRCEVTTLRPTYLPWATDPEGIEPTDTDHGRLVGDRHGRLTSNAWWKRGEGSDDLASISKIPFTGGRDEPGPALPDGTPGFINSTSDDAASDEITWNPAIDKVTWSISWTSRFPDGCRSLHLILQLAGASDEELRRELIKIARSLTDS